MEKTPFRKDVSDGKRYPKAELRRFVVKEGKLLYDPEQRLPGRGYYLSKGSDPVKAEKAYAVYSAVRGGLVDTLIIDSNLGSALLDLSEKEPL